MIFQSEIEELAYQYSLRTGDDHDGYLAGAAALENLILKSGDSFDEKKIDAKWKEILDAENRNICRDYEKTGNLVHQYETHIILAEWMHSKSQLIIGALKQQLAELNKNCISIDLHESRMKKIESNYDAAIKVQDILREKLEAV